jgi:hypothetical protein
MTEKLKEAIVDAFLEEGTVGSMFATVEELNLTLYQHDGDIDAGPEDRHRRLASFLWERVTCPVLVVVDDDTLWSIYERVAERALAKILGEGEKEKTRV